MIPEVRAAFNRAYKPRYYEALQQEVLNTFGEPCPFRISETPVFISKDLGRKVFQACDSILGQLEGIDFEAIRRRFIPESLQNPAPVAKPHFLAIDFGLCEDESGGIVPQLIELQAFPSLLYYQHFLGQAYGRHYPNLPEKGFHYFFSGLDEKTYLQEMKRVILGAEAPENVILLELFPQQQKTRIDFAATRQVTGIPVVCITEVRREANRLYYRKGKRNIPIHRIYNRVIFDELLRYPELKTNFRINEAAEVEWITHPDWFFMISKCIMPLLSHEFIPASYYLNALPETLELKEFVLKPLFSFAGKGINLNPEPQDLARLEDPQNYILQRKVNYAPLVKTLTKQNSKVELRMLYTRTGPEAKLRPVINLTRMNTGALINVSHLTKDSWIGSSISYFET